MNRRIKITVAEPSVIVREGLIVVLNFIDNMHIEVTEVSDIEQLRGSMVRQRPDMLIVNPSFTGLFSVPQIKKEADNPDMKCVALQVSMADSAALKFYDETISIYDSAQQIKEKITRLIHRPEADRRHELLSQREKEVIICVIQGMTNKQIADQLCLSAHTVITHRRNISAKLDIHSTAGLTIYAIVNKLVDIDSLPADGKIPM